MRGETTTAERWTQGLADVMHAAVLTAGWMLTDQCSLCDGLLLLPPSLPRRRCSCSLLGAAPPSSLTAPRCSSLFAAASSLGQGPVSAARVPSSSK